MQSASIATASITSDKIAGEPWIAYTPQWTNGSPSIGNGTIRGKYTRIGNTVHFNLVVSMGTTTNYGSNVGAWHFSLPVPPKDLDDVFAVHILDFAVAHHMATTQTLSNNRFLIIDEGNTGSGIGVGVPFAWKANDMFWVSGTYEAQ